MNQGWMTVVNPIPLFLRRTGLNFAPTFLALFRQGSILQNSHVPDLIQGHVFRIHAPLFDGFQQEK